MTDPASIYAKAREGYQWFEQVIRPDGTPFVRTKQDAPEWLTELVRSAHGDDFLLDDWRYKTTRDALGFIADDEPDDLLDAASEFADSAVDVYTGALLVWLSSNLRRVSYCDEALSEFGGWSDGEYGRGGGEPVGIVMAISRGQYKEAHEVYSSVVESLTELVEDASAV